MFSTPSQVLASCQSHVLHHPPCPLQKEVLTTNFKIGEEPRPERSGRGGARGGRGARGAGRGAGRGAPSGAPRAPRGEGAAPIAIDDQNFPTLGQ